jgi:hypothetical protein
MATTHNKFAATMQKVGDRIPGPKGALTERTTDSARLDWFNKIQRDSDYSTCKRAVQEILKEYDAQKYTEELANFTHETSTTILIDLFRLWAHKRGCHGYGEGNRDSAHYLLIALYDHYPETVCRILEGKLYSDFGYWKDYVSIIKLIHSVSHELKLSVSAKYQKYDAFVKSCRTAMLSQRTEDIKQLTTFYNGLRPSKTLNEVSLTEFSQIIESASQQQIRELKISLVGKYLVNEKAADNDKAYWYIGSYDIPIKVKHVSFFVRALLKSYDTSKNLVSFPAYKSIPYKVYRSYRQLNSKLRNVTVTLEQLTCGNAWDKIDPKRIPSVAKFRQRKALLNEKVKQAPTDSENETGNRHPDDPKRVQCRQSMREHLKDPSRIKTTGLLPHEIAVASQGAKSTADKDMQQALWEAMVITYNERIAKIKAELAEKAGEASSAAGPLQNAQLGGNMIGIADVSGSMTWVRKSPNRPLDIACGLTAFMSQVASPPFRDLACSFSSDPTIIHMKDMSVSQRMTHLQSHAGYTTDLLKMNRTLCNLCVENRVPELDLPILVIFSDEGFDNQCGVTASNYHTTHETIIRYWYSHGYKRAPTMVYWNLAASNPNKGTQTSKNYPGVMFLQGWSPNLFDYIIYGEGAETVEIEVVVDGKATKVKTSSITPWMTFRKAMDKDTFFEPLLRILHLSREKNLFHYTRAPNVDDLD